MANDNCEEKFKDMKFLKNTGFKIRVTLSALIWVGWLAFIVLYLFMLANDWGHSVLEGIGTLLVSFIVAVGVTIAMWISWGMNFAANHEEFIEWKIKEDLKAKRIRDDLEEK
jgi:hypothetical protein